MARIRTIKPDFFRSKTIDRLTYEQRLTFIGLWTHVDDEGRCEYDPDLIKADIWPRGRSVEAVEDDLKALTACSLITHYSVNECSYVQVNGWREHQRINRPTPSRLPASSPDSIVPLTSTNESSVNGQVGLTEYSPPERKGRERKGKEQRTDSLRSSGADAPPPINAGTITAVWVEAFRAATDRPPSTSMRNQAGREAKRLLDDGADPPLVVEAATLAGQKGFATLEREYGPLAARAHVQSAPDYADFQLPTPPREIRDDPDPEVYHQWARKQRDEWDAARRHR